MGLKKRAKWNVVSGVHPILCFKISPFAIALASFGPRKKPLQDVFDSAVAIPLSDKAIGVGNSLFNSMRCKADRVDPVLSFVVVFCHCDLKRVCSLACVVTNGA